jgi:hypothetical protein
VVLMLKELMSGSRVVGYYPNLARALGGAKAGLLFCQLAYWCGDKEWIHITEGQFEEATALTRDEQAGARKVLTDKGAIEIERKGAPARLYYRINWQKVESLFGPATCCGNSGTDAEIPQQVIGNSATIYSVERSEKSKKEEHTYLDDGGFAEFYTNYPRHEGRVAAFRAWRAKELTKADAARLVADVAKRYEFTEKQFIPHPATYLNQERWNDEIVPRVLTREQELERERAADEARYEEAERRAEELRRLTGADQ